MALRHWHPIEWNNLYKLNVKLAREGKNMTITTTGDVVDTVAADGDLWVGNTGTGSLTVNSGSVKSVTAAGTGSAGAEARLWVGRTATGDGTVTISGAGSVVEVVSGGRPDAGATAQIGRGGTGTVSISAGGTLRVTDPTGVAYDQTAGIGNEAINVGRDSGGNGTLQVNAGHVVLSGTGAVMNVGRAGGTGSARFENGSTLDLSSTIAAGDVGLQIGRGSQGTVSISDSTATLTSGGASATSTEDYGAYVQVGREVGGVGGLTLLNSTLALSGDSNLPGSPGAYTSLQIGRDGGNGAMAVTNSVITLTNSPEGAYVFVGRSSVNNVSTTGSLSVSSSTITADSTGFANLNIARGNGTSGQMTVSGTSVLLFEGDLGASLQVGTLYNASNTAGGTGSLTINTGSTVTIQSDNAGSFAGAQLGQYGGTATVNIDGGTLRLVGAAAAFMNIGYQVDFTQPGNVVANSAGTGSLILTNGATLSMSDGTGTSAVRLGGGVGNATMEIRSGSIASLDQGDATANTYVAVGSGLDGSGTASLLVSGAGSRLEGVGFIGVGFSGENNTTGGNGQLIVENGGRIVTTNGFTVGPGGRLSGDGGTIEMQPGRFGIVTDGGAVGDTGGAIQHLTIVGNFALDYADARFDISSTGHDQITVQSAGGTSGTSGVTSMIAADFDLNVLGGYQFTAGETRTFVTSQAGIGVDLAEFANSTVAINGQHADFSYYLGLFGGGSSFGMIALNSGANGGDSILDFGATSTLDAQFTYSSATGTARVSGGALGAGGIAVGVDSVFGSSFNDTFNASQTTQAMTFYGREGNDTLIGGSGRDTALYGIASTGATITRNGDGSITVNAGTEGVDTLRSIEKLQFIDKTIDLDVNRAARGDFNGDGTSDVLLQSGGTLIEWFMQNGGYQSGTTLAGGLSGYAIKAIGDFNGDGIADISLQNGGTVVNFLLNSDGSYKSGYTLATGLSGFEVVGSGDFNGDGNADLLLEGGGALVNFLLDANGQYMSGNTIATGLAGYSAKAVGDFNGDGIDDVMLQNGGTIVEFLLNGSGTYMTGNTITTTATGFEIRGAGDFNGDGIDDIVLQNGGTVVNFLLNNAGTYASGNTMTTTATGFNVVGTGDYNGDGTSDMLLYDGSIVVQWTLQNGAYQSGNTIATGLTGFDIH